MPQPADIPFDRVPVGLYRTDAGGACLRVSDRWCAIAGVGRGDAAGRIWTDAVHP